MYNAAYTGVVKVSRLPADFFDHLFLTQSPEDVQKVVNQYNRNFKLLLADESIPKPTRKFIGDIVERSAKGKLNETMALKAVPLLYSMSTRAGGNSVIRWSVFSRDKKTKGLEMVSDPRGHERYADYSIHPKYLRMGRDIFDLLNTSGKNVLSEMSKGMHAGGIIPWARVDYRTTKPITGKNTFAIVDVGAGSVGTHEKDVIAGHKFLPSNIARRLIDSVLTYHQEKRGSPPKKVIIALPEEYFNEKGEIIKSKPDILGLRQKFRNALRHEQIFPVPYSAIHATDSKVNLHWNNLKIGIGHNDMLFIYNPNKPMNVLLERKLSRHLTTIGSRSFAAISDKRKNGSFLLVAKRESKTGRVIVPKRGKILMPQHTNEIPALLTNSNKGIPGTGVVIKLPTPIESRGKALPSAIFLNTASPFQIKAASRALTKHFNAGSRTLATEQLIRPASVKGSRGSLEIRLYHAGKTSKNLVHRRRK